MASPGQAKTRQKSSRHRPVTLMVHGAGGGGWEFNVWRGHFEAAGWRVRSPDLKPVDAGLEVTTLDDYLGQMRRIVLRSAPNLLVGASLGGLLALLLAADCPDAGVVLVNPLPPAPLAAQLPPREWPDRMTWSNRHDLRGTRRAMSGADAASAWYANQRWRDESGAVLWAAHAGVELPVIPRRCLLISGARDDSVPIGLQRALGEMLAAARLELPEADHLDPLMGGSAHRCASAALEWVSSASLSSQRLSSHPVFR
jgi:pimeloyl-ACP methyl ester carboxylesterase